jgi:hypothetical protein
MLAWIIVMSLVVSPRELEAAWAGAGTIAIAPLARTAAAAPLARNRRQ